MRSFPEESLRRPSLANWEAGNRRQKSAAHYGPILAVVLLCLAVAAGCGRRDGDVASGGENARDRNVVPTMPAARFDQPTAAVDLKDASEADKTADLSGPDIETGALIYSNRCAECHGEGAAGTDQAAALVGLTLSEDAFDDLIRTGGELGPDHLFGPTRISPDGLKAVYAYLTSLE